MAASPEWLELLAKRNIHPRIVEFFTTNKVLSICNFANYVLSREEIQTGILDVVKGGLETDKTQRMLLHEMWREAEEIERLRVSRNARGVQEDDLEDPLPTGSIDEIVLGFAQIHLWTPALTEMLCEPLFARITREIQRRNHSVVPLERVRSANETSRHAVGKQINVSVNLSMRLGAAGVPMGSRDIEDNYIAVHLVRLLFEGGYAVAGHNIKIEGKPFCTFQECHDYVIAFAERATPFGVPHPALHRVLKAHNETHALWAKTMRLGKTLSDAMKINESKVSALWLFACENEALKASRSNQVMADLEADKERVKRDHPGEREYFRSPSRGGRRGAGTPPRPRKPEAPRLRSRERVSREDRSGKKDTGKAKGAGKSPRGATNPIFDKTRDSKVICSSYNAGNCSLTTCRNLHICNWRTPAGEACAKNHRRCDAH